MKKGLTEIVFLLDRSGSMAGLESDTIGGRSAVQICHPHRRPALAWRAARRAGPARLLLSGRTGAGRGIRLHVGRLSADRLGQLRLPERPGTDDRGGHHP